MHFTYLLLPFIMALAATGAAASQNPPIAKPGCMDRCGDKSIPFPFGTNKSCYHSEGFWVTCDQRSGSPRLLWPKSSNIEIKSISLNGQMRIMAFIAYDCRKLISSRSGVTGQALQPTNPDVAVKRSPYQQQPADPIRGGQKYSIRGQTAVRYGERVTYSNTSSIIELPGNFTFNSTINKFTVVGYAANGFLSGLRNNSTYSTGCRTRDAIEQDLGKGTCKGSGCCQTSIPPDAQTANVTVAMEYMDNNCTYGFLAEGDAFGFSLESLINLTNVVQEFPVLVDWAIGDVTCKEAKNSSSNYACISKNSTCYEPETGSGYRCRCTDGYDGNPYRRDGCQDINECHLEPKKYCHHHCKNTIGGYECRCHRGYRGDGRVDGSGCTRDELLIVKIVTGVFGGIIFLLLAAWLVSVQLNRRKLRRMMQKHFIDNGGERLQRELKELERQTAKQEGRTTKLPKKIWSASTFKIFKQSEMEDATDSFNSVKMLGKGGFGIVYKGKLRDGREVAIKEPKTVDINQIDNFITEVIVLSQINHKNVVKLLGCCLERKPPLLVYEFIRNGDLSSYIHDGDPEKATELNWRKRLKIAIETASALSYLHFDTTTKIIHRDIKPENILLDHNFTAKVSDFGAARLVPLDTTQNPTLVIGTKGYLDPEFEKTKKFTTQSDVYGFGAVLLGLLTEKRPINKNTGENFVVVFLSLMQQPSQRESLLFKHVVGHILSEENKDQIIKVAELAHRCLNPEGKDRPSMKEVEMELNKLVE